jgi:hypothetical protein
MTEMVSTGKSTTNLFMKIKEQQVILTASICLLALVAVLKNVLLVSTEVLTRDVVIYLIIYLGFLTFAFKPDGNYRKSQFHPIVWDLLVVFITLAIIVVYAW